MKIAVIILALFLTVAACSSPQSVAQAPQSPTLAEPVQQSACSTAECFVEAARNCEDSEVTLRQSGGTFKYSSTQCILTKTLVSLDPSEKQEIKLVLEGKSLACTYQKGNFDPRWVNSLVFGLERCEGKLKDALAWLLMLA
ncbi:hypothetical protein HY490_03180 [Candidatus Woesearchaeota archaeon]|nr:hypothetical protein [Candidatus Woesearchaeota archaeon]